MNIKKKPKTTIIIGARPTGLTAAYELLERTAMKSLNTKAAKKSFAKQ